MGWLQGFGGGDALRELRGRAGEEYRDGDGEVDGGEARGFGDCGAG